MANFSLSQTLPVFCAMACIWLAWVMFAIPKECKDGGRWPELPDPAAAALIRIVEADVLQQRLAEDAFLAAKQLATKALPDCAKSHVMLGHYLWNLHAFAAASDAWRHALSLQPRCSNFRQMVADATRRAAEAKVQEQYVEQESYHSHGRTPWRPVQPLNTTLQVQPYDSLVDTWRSMVSTMTESVVRLWAAEAGEIENIYILKEGVSTALARLGFSYLTDTDVSHTRLPKHMVFGVMQDHAHMLRGLAAHALSQSNVSESFVLGIHFNMTANTPFVRMRDPHTGAISLALLSRGQWKRGANDVGELQTMPAPECPAQMARLISLFNEYMLTQDPVLVSAWVQYEFVRAHCFVDTNGRTSRALGSLALLRAKLPPFALDPSHKQQYYTALKLANAGDMQQWVNFIRLELYSLVSRLRDL
eukprot:TRINITY_DN13001_c0_g1_i1.p1 TRINITY_DN13001_c0_g1~~TRINITY_DN13001_c0_g1_i1.p1  ORF type:complete len:419 (-),score=46.24 TRINITY_DN13001_c0_g1_i1:72-1328(-)